MLSHPFPESLAVETSFIIMRDDIVTIIKGKAGKAPPFPHTASRPFAVTERLFVGNVHFPSKPLTRMV